jgi:hypothetical protein
METIDLFAAHAPLRLAGILDITRTETGGEVSRLPASARAQIIDPAVLAMAAMPAGGRIELTTDADALELDVLLTHLHFGDVILQPKVVDLVVDHKLTAMQSTTEGPVLHFPDPRVLSFEFQPGGPATFRFEGMGRREKQVELWLPHNAGVELRALRLSTGATVARTVQGSRLWVHYGSSISHSTEVPRPTDVWSTVVARRAGVDLQSLALSGQCHLDQFVARTIRDLPVDLVSFKAGANIVAGDTMRERAFVPALHGFLDAIRDAHPHIPIIVGSPVICPAFEDHPGPGALGQDGIWYGVDRPAALADGALTIRRCRELVEGAVSTRRGQGDTNLHYLSGLDLFGPDDGADLPDGLHPSIDGYGRIAERFYDRAFAPGRPFG